MKKTTPAAALALSLVCGTAFAADLPSRMILPAPPALRIAETFTWNGFYAGLNAGGAWNSATRANALNIGPLPSRTILAPASIQLNTCRLLTPLSKGQSI